jgi:hypothetical protein
MADVQNFSGIVTAVPAVAGKCGMVIAPGAQPTVPEPGGIWYDTGDDAMAYFAPDGTVTYLPKGTGTSGQVLTSNGAATVPTWKAASGGILSLRQELGGSSASNFTTESQIANPSVAMPTAIMNTIGRKLVFKGIGKFTTAGGQTPAVSIIFEFGGVDVLTVVTTALVASQTAKIFTFEFSYITTGTGATGTGQAFGQVTIDNAGTGAFTTTYAATLSTSPADITGAIKPRLNVSASSTLASIEVDSFSWLVYPTTV